MSSYKTVMRETTVAAAIADAFDEIENLASEMGDWRDNLEEKFSSTDKYERVSEAASTLEYISRPSDDVTEAIGEIKIQYCESVPKAKARAPSRATRAANVVQMLNAAIEAIRDELEKLRDGDADTMDDDYMMLDSIADDIENSVSEIEGVEFPGAFGG